MPTHFIFCNWWSEYIFLWFIISLFCIILLWVNSLEQFNEHWQILWNDHVNVSILNSWFMSRFMNMLEFYECWCIYSCDIDWFFRVIILTLFYVSFLSWLWFLHCHVDMLFYQFCPHWLILSNHHNHSICLTVATMTDFLKSSFQHKHNHMIHFQFEINENQKSVYYLIKNGRAENVHVNLGWFLISL